jgi:hypothetical protein
LIHTSYYSSMIIMIIEPTASCLVIWLNNILPQIGSCIIFQHDHFGDKTRMFLFIYIWEVAFTSLLNFLVIQNLIISTYNVNSTRWWSFFWQALIDGKGHSVGSPQHMLLTPLLAVLYCYGNNLLLTILYMCYMYIVTKLVF